MAEKITTEIFIERARKVHGDKYGYSKVEYVNVFSKVCIICPTHGEFFQVARQHLKGRGCSECAGCNKWTYETCYEVAKQYQSRSDFKNNEVGAYTRALKNNWLKNYTWFKRPTTGQNEWDYDKCYEEAQKYSSKTEFQKGSYTAYKKSRENNWIDDYTWLINPAPTTSVWDYDSCYKEAQKYNTRKQFQKGCSSAYKKAREKGWLKDYSWFVNGYILEGQKRRKWNYETCYEEAKKYNSRTEFQYGKGASCAYKMARKEGWLNDYTWFKQSPKENGFWSKEQCYKEAKKYQYLVEFRHESASAYTIARRENWLNSYTWLIKKRKKWKYSECLELAKKYNRRSEYKNGCPSAYVASLENEWMDDYTWFQEKPRNKYWTQERCYEEAQKYKTKKEFASNSSAYSIACKNGWIVDYNWLIDNRIDIIKDKIDCVYSYYFKETHTIYIGRTINRKERDYQHIFQTDRDTVAKYAKDHGIAVPPMVILEDFLTLKEGLAKEDYWRAYYKDQGFTILNKAKTGIGSGSIGSIGYGKWNKERCLEEAKKYTTRSEFKDGNGSAYSAACKKGWLKLCTWFATPFHEDWTYETCYAVAQSYEYKKDFYTQEGGAYYAAKRNGWLKDFVWLKSSLGLSRRKWNHETCLIAAKKCSSKVEFESNYPAAMNNARKNGWLKEYTWFQRPTSYNKKWTYDKCLELVSNFHTRTEFHKAYPGAYTACCKNGWIDEFFSKKEKE